MLHWSSGTEAKAGREHGLQAFMQPECIYLWTLQERRWPVFDELDNQLGTENASTYIYSNIEEFFEGIMTFVRRLPHAGCRCGVSRKLRG